MIPMARATVRLIVIVVALAAGPMMIQGVASAAAEAHPPVTYPAGFAAVLAQAEKTSPQLAELQRELERAASVYRAASALRSGLSTGIRVPVSVTEDRILGGTELRFTRALGDGELSFSLGIGALRQWKASSFTAAPLASLSVRYPLGIPYDVEQMRADLAWQQAEWRFVEERRDWERNLLRAYLDYLLALHDVRVAEARLAYAEEHLRSTEAKHEAGIASQLAVFEARQSLFDAEDALDAARRAEEERRYALLRLTGTETLPAGATDTAPRPWRTPVEEFPRLDDLDAWQALALQGRRDVPLAEAKVELAQRALEKARGVTGPRWELQGGLAYPTSSGLDAEIMILLTVPLQQPVEDEAVLQAQLDVAQAEAGLTAARQRVEDEVRAARSAYEAALRRVERAKEQAAHAALILEDAVMRYAKGYVPREDVLEAEWLLARAERGLAEAEVDLLVALVQLWHKAGKDVEW